MFYVLLEFVLEIKILPKNCSSFFPTHLYIKAHFSWFCIDLLKKWWFTMLTWRWQNGANQDKTITVEQSGRFFAEPKTLKPHKRSPRLWALISWRKEKVSCANAYYTRQSVCPCGWRVSTPRCPTIRHFWFLIVIDILKIHKTRKSSYLSWWSWPDTIR